MENCVDCGQDSGFASHCKECKHINDRKACNVTNTWLGGFDGHHYGFPRNEFGDNAFEYIAGWDKASQESVLTLGAI